MAESHDSNRVTSPFEALPFVRFGGVPWTPVAREPDPRFWQLPAAGLSFLDGCAAGKFAALAYLRFMQRQPRGLYDSLLGSIVSSIAARMASAKPDEVDALHGHVVGFFQEVEGVVALRNFKLLVSDEEIAAGLEDALAGGVTTRHLKRLADERSEQARRAALARWRKRRADQVAA